MFSADNFGLILVAVNTDGGGFLVGQDAEEQFTCSFTSSFISVDRMGIVDIVTGAAAHCAVLVPFTRFVKEW
jgi:hypothetical protein